MVSLKPMNTEQFNAWFEIAVKEYAEDKIRAGNVTRDEALQVSEREFSDLLPDGTNTADTYIFTVEDDVNSQTVGMLWLKIRNQRQEMFVYDIRMDEQYRGQGYGKQTMQALEDFVRELGIPKISLHVFGDNEIAIRLYQSVGFVPTNILMSKVLSK